MTPAQIKELEDIGNMWMSKYGMDILSSFIDKVKTPMVTPTYSVTISWKNKRSADAFLGELNDWRRTAPTKVGPLITTFET